MKVHLIRKQSVEAYAAKNAQSRAPLEEWLTTIKFADWNRPNDINATFNSADLLGKSSSRVVFDIGGNNYRMICKYHFGEKQVHLFICWIGTHAAYDALKRGTVYHKYLLTLIMETMKYRVIKSKTQYREYTHILEELVFADGKNKNTQDEIDLLTVLIDKWDAEHNTFNDIHPIELLQSLMSEQQLIQKDLADLLNVSKGYVSDILSYHKGLSKDNIRILATHFKVSQEAFNRPYPLSPRVRVAAVNTNVSAGRKKRKLAYQ